MNLTYKVIINNQIIEFNNRVNAISVIYNAGYIGERTGNTFFKGQEIAILLTEEAKCL